MAERLFYIASGLALAVMAGMLVLRVAANPLDTRREWLEAQLSNIPPTLSIEGGDGEQASVWQAGIESKPGLWEGLIAPPPPPPAAAPKAPTTPDLSALLKGVRASTRGIGNKAFLVWPGNLRGDYVSVGEEIQRCKVKAIDKDFVTFSYFWKEGNMEIISKVKRERGRLK